MWQFVERFVYLQQYPAGACGCRVNFLFWNDSDAWRYGGYSDHTFRMLADLLSSATSIQVDVLAVFFVWIFDWHRSSFPIGFGCLFRTPGMFLSVLAAG
jgi:hypothetical protein